MISPDGRAWEPSAPLVDRALVRALARAFRWRRMLDEGVYGTFDELAKAEHVSQSYVSRLVRLTQLAPDIIEAILDGRQPEGLQLESLLLDFPMTGAVNGKHVGQLIYLRLRRCRPEAGVRCDAAREPLISRRIAALPSRRSGGAQGKLSGAPKRV